MRKYSLLLALFVFWSAFGQVGPRGWQDHISLNTCNSVAKSGKMIYASYGSGIVRFDEKELSPYAINKINGLSDVGVRLLRANSYNGKTLVIYDNCNIDVIEPGGKIINYPDFKMKSLNGKKLVNEVTFHNQLAYLACGFGIVVFDTDKLEIRDTYIIGPNATNMDVLQVALTDSLIFAATPQGIFRSNYKTKILNNFQNWIYDTVRLKPGFYSGVVNAGGIVLTTCSPSRLNSNDKGKDSVFTLNDSAKWVKYPPLAHEGGRIFKLGPVFENVFSMFDDIGLIVRRATDGGLMTHINSFNGIVDYGQYRDACITRDHTGNYSYWMADNRFGLYQTYGVYPYFPQNQVTRNGMNRPQIGNIDILDGVVAVSPSLIENAGVGNFIREGINMYKDQEWSYFPTLDDKGEPLLDVTSVLLDRRNKNSTYIATWSYGIVHYKDGKEFAVYTHSNTPAMPNMPGLTKLEPRCGGLSQDKNGNVWFAHSDQKGFLGMLTPEGKYQNFQFDLGRFTRKTFADRNNNIWMLHERDGGITVFKPQKVGSVYASPQPTVNYMILNSTPGTGNLASNSVFSIAEDHDGRMWIGTAAGIRVIYNPNAVFNPGADYDAQPIKIVQDGNVELLLDKETVTCIVVDGANNKWIGTSLGGVYCFSPDGQVELYHFTEANSPLYSNNIIDIKYDEISGDIFIGTERGLQSFRSLIVAGEESYTNVYAYPNPVKPGFDGSVMIRGLMDNSIVKITDAAGNLVWETKATGGQIEWPVKTLNGQRVVTGVYIVYATTPTAESKAMAKVMVVN